VLHAVQNAQHATHTPFVGEWTLQKPTF